MRRIVSLVAAEPGWPAVYGAEFAPDSEFARVVAWALVEDDEAVQSVVGMVVDSTDPTQIVPAPEGVAVSGPHFDRYGFNEV